MLIKVYRQHPKKTLLLLMALFGFVTFKFRNELFQKFIEKLQGKLTRDMKIQMEKSEKINHSLDKIKQVVEAYYQNSTFRVLAKRTFQFEQLNEAGKKLQQKNPVLTALQKQEIYQEMTNGFLIFDVSTLQLLRYFECASLLPKILMINGPQMESLFMQNLLDEVQEQICAKQYIHLVRELQIRTNNEIDKFKYNSKMNFIDLIKNLIIDSQQSIISQKYWSELQKEIISYKKTKLLSLQQFNGGVLSPKVVQSADTLVNQLIEINKSNVMVTFLQYSISFSFQKLINRISLLPNINEFQNEILLKQLTTVHKIILQEFYDDNSNRINMQYYQTILQQAGKIKEPKENIELEKSEQNNIKQILKVLHESKLYELLQTSQNQIIRKIIFGKEFGETTSSQESSLGALFKQ